MLALANQGLEEDPAQIRYVYFRAQAKENLSQYAQALEDYASVVKQPNPYKFKSIMKLKTLCISVC